MGADATYTPDTVMPDGKRNQLGSTHDLGQNFSKAYDIKITNQDKEEQYAFQTCFGPGIWRCMAALIGVHGDDQGLIIPFDMAPTQIVIVPITIKSKPELSTKVLETCNTIFKKLRKKYRVEYDDRDYSPGLKFNEWELKGVPIRIEIGPRDLEHDNVTLAVRTSSEKMNVKLADIETELAQEIDLHERTIEERASHYMDERISETNDLKELIGIMQSHRGFVKVPWCSVEDEGKHCEGTMKEATQGGRVCGTLYPKEDAVESGQTCVVCNKEAKHIVYVAKSY